MQVIKRLFGIFHRRKRHPEVLDALRTLIEYNRRVQNINSEEVSLIEKQIEILQGQVTAIRSLYQSEMYVLEKRVEILEHRVGKLVI